MSRQSSEELALLECFSVPEVGVFSVYVYEIQINGTVGHKVWRLPDVTTSGDRAEESVGTTHGLWTNDNFDAPKYSTNAC